MQLESGSEIDVGDDVGYQSAVTDMEWSSGSGMTVTGMDGDFGNFSQYSGVSTHSLSNFSTINNYRKGRGISNRYLLSEGPSEPVLSFVPLSGLDYIHDFEPDLSSGQRAPS